MQSSESITTVLPKWIFRILFNINKIFADERLIGLLSIAIGVHMWVIPNAGTVSFLNEASGFIISPLIFFLITTGTILSYCGKIEDLVLTTILITPLIVYMVLSYYFSQIHLNGSYEILVRDFFIILFVLSRYVKRITIKYAKIYIKS